MAEIPSHIPASVAPAGLQASEVSKERDSRRAASADRADRGIQAISDRDTTIDTEDGDTAVFADAEGTGSQGRPFEESVPEEETPEGEDSPKGVVEGDDGHVHLDLEA